MVAALGSNGFIEGGAGVEAHEAGGPTPELRVVGREFQDRRDLVQSTGCEHPRGVGKVEPPVPVAHDRLARLDRFEVEEVAVEQNRQSGGRLPSPGIAPRNYLV